MTDLPKYIKVRRILKAFKSIDFDGNGTKHHKLTDSKGRIATITRSKDEITSGMLRTIFKQAELTTDEIEKFTNCL